MATLQRLRNKLTIAAFLLILQTEYFSCHALLLKCPLYQMHLQKIVGFRPPIDYLDERNLIYAPTMNNFRDRNRTTRDGHTTTPITNDGGGGGSFTIDNHAQDRTPPPAAAICWSICNEDDDCVAYVHLLDTNECYGFSYLERSQRYQAIGGGELQLVADAEAIFYEKTCLKVPEMCKNRLWTLTRIPGTSLVFQGKKTVSTLVTRRECAEMCLFEREFKCLSASFAPSYRNNRERFREHAPPNERITLGRCKLSDKDKTIQPDAFRAAPYDEEYIENQCYERAIESDNCSYELYANSSFIYAEARFVGLTQKECQSYCSHEKKFYCQGVSFHHNFDLSQSECLLHSEDIISMGPRSLKLRENSVYMRRVKCLDVQVLCTLDEMAIKYTPKDWFRGKMYASSHSKDCVAQGNGTKSTLLRLAIGSEARESRCGILRAYEVTKDYQRIFISALIVIQNNINVQMQGDRLIKVGCIMSNTTTKAPITDQNDVDDEDDDDAAAQSPEEEVPNAIALESSLAFMQHALPNEGSLHYNISGERPQRPLPKITLQVIDLAHQHETHDVQIGQNLELQIVAEYTPLQELELSTDAELPPLPDFRATLLTVKTSDNQNYVLLIDERGCPTDVSVFPALERMRTSGRNVLSARFHAFKFAGSSMVKFDVKIHFCAHNCSEENCDAGLAEVEWSAAKRRRRRRRRQLSLDQQQQQRMRIQNPVYISTVMDVGNHSHYNQTEPLYYRNRTQAPLDDDDGDTLPLNFDLNVRGPDRANSNSFIYGERGILLIAGIDDQLHLDSICLNQSLLIALLIFWLIFQVALMFGCCYVIQKYKGLAMLEDERRKIHEEYLESRRVHWADQGSGYTL